MSALTLASVTSCNAIIGNEDRVLRESDAGNPNRKDGGDDPILDPKDGGVIPPSDADAPDAEPAEPQLVLTTTQPDQVAIVNGTLYFSHNEAPSGGVSWCDADNCTKPTLFFNQSTGAHGLAADSKGVAVTSAAANLIYAYPLRYAGTGQALLSNMAQPVAVAVDATSTFFTTAGGGLYRCGRTTCAGGPTLVAMGTAPGGAVAVGDTFAVWASLRSSPSAPAGEGFLQQVAKTSSNGTPKTASFGRDPRTFVMGPGSNRLLWTASDGPTAYQGEVTLRPSALEDTETLCQTKLGDPWGIAVDATHIYFTVSSAGEVRRVPIDQCTKGAETIAMGQGKPRGIAVDDTHVYWANFNGTIMRLKKK